MATYTVSPERPDGTSATYASHRPSDMFHGIEPWNIQSNTPTQLIFHTMAGNRLVLKGTGFVFDKDAPNPWIAGTINAAELWNQNLSLQYASITEIAADLNTFGSRLWTEAVLDLLLNGNDTILGGQGSDHLRGMSGDDDISGNAGDDYINPGAGSDTIDGGEGFNGIDYGEYQSTDAAQLTGISINLSSDSFVDP